MIILLTNDDGYQSEGINTLERVLASYGHEIWVCAPSGNRSAQSHAMNIISPVTLTRYKENHFHCSGTPTDCILYSIKGRVFPSLPDVVISGINHGYNCSADILYSGTCGAASEAVLQGLPAIALSCESDDDKSFAFESASHFVAKNLDKLIKLTTADSIVNLNFPTPHSDRVVPSTLGIFKYQDIALPVEKTADSITFKLSASADVTKIITNPTADNDFEVSKGGDISLTVLKVLPLIDEEKQREAMELFNG